MSADLSNLLKFSDITPRVKTHLNQVYGTLSIGCLTAAATCLWTPVWLVTNIMFLIFSLIATIGLVVTMHAKRGNSDHGTKFVCFLLITAIDGASLKPLVQSAIDLDPVLVVNALVYTGVVFGSFTLTSFLTGRRSMLFLGGILSSVMLGMSVGMLLSFFTGVSFISYFAYNVIMLVVFSLYIMYDTQLIIEKAHQGDFDYNLHSLDLFIDLVRIFIHILRILMEMNKDKKNK